MTRKMDFRLLVCGSRDWEDKELLEQALVDATSGYLHITLVHGGARGADTMAATWANKVNKILSARSDIGTMIVECHPAAWDAHGYSAGPIRNKEMANLGADLCIAFIRHNSPGSTNMVQNAKAQGIPTAIYRA